ncbi:MAG: glycosyltransferase family 39 protein [Pirellulales bacterium]
MTTGMLVALMLAALAPRAVLGYRRAVLNSDAVFFVEQAMALDRGDIDDGLEKLGLNVYPFLLVGLHRAGLDWEVAGELSSLAFSTLTIVPLFFWVCRLFDRRAAVAACLLWACHIEAVEWGPVTIRDPLFWFEVNLSLFASLEAARRNALAWYVAAWTVIALAFLTRIEGALLTVPLVWWTLTLATSPQRLRSLARLCGAALAVPLVFVAINVTLLAGHHHWEWGRLAYGRIVYQWVASACHTSTVAQPSPQAAATHDVTEPDRGAARRAQPPVSPRHRVRCHYVRCSGLSALTILGCGIRCTR